MPRLLPVLGGERRQTGEFLAERLEQVCGLNHSRRRRCCLFIKRAQDHFGRYRDVADVEIKCVVDGVNDGRDWAVGDHDEGGSPPHGGVD